ncbi:MAG: hypothetical protein PPHEMADM_3086 [uncultured Paraburkholderia sp.]|nr:MAG: hypothetical protein PPHEMADE_3059 [uncultured Paraburkholderia sp.]CAH2928821.1 MAG: hypothetical protein PPHEMADM_3086 [uncultured Paraburkholderia sp.]
MWFRAVATAMAVWCASGASGARTASKAKTKIAAKHAAASAPVGKSKAKDGVKRVATRPGHESAGAVHDAKQKRAAVAHADKSHTEAAKTGHAGKSPADSAKVAHADAAQAGAAHGGAVTTGATGSAADPGGSCRYRRSRSGRRRGESRDSPQRLAAADLALSGRAARRLGPRRCGQSG